MWKYIQTFWDNLLAVIGILIISALALVLCIEYPIMWLPVIVTSLWLWQEDKKEKQNIKHRELEKKHYYSVLKKAQQGDPAAKYDYGKIILLGHVVKLDQKLALRWINSAALMNEPRALFKMGEVYDLGLYNHPIDKIKSIHFFIKAAKLGHPKAKEIVDSQTIKRKERYELEDKIIKLSISAWNEYHSLGLTMDIDSMSGVEFEKYIGKLYISMGYDVSFTTINNDQGTDIIAKKDKDKISIQVKRYKSSVGNKAVQETIAGANFHSCNKTAVITNSTYTKSAKELAKRSGTELIDGKKLIYLIKKYSNKSSVDFDLSEFYKLRDRILKYSPHIQEELNTVENRLKNLDGYNWDISNIVLCRNINWKYQCPLEWHELELTNNNDVRHCTQCNSKVYYTNDAVLLSRYALEGKCTASNINTDSNNLGYHNEEVLLGLREMSE